MIPATGAPPLDVRRFGVLPYAEAVSLQRALVERRREGTVPDTLLLLEHPHVLTLGTGSDPAHVLADAAERERLALDLVETRRGGDVTYHGPGQLVGYPILQLETERRDLHGYLRDLEQTLIDALLELGLETRRVRGATGVWARGGKIAALGVRVSSRWITSHGFALNVSPDLRYFETIVPCGLDDRRVTSIERELGRPGERADVERAVVGAFSRIFRRRVRGEPWSGSYESPVVP